MLRRSENVSAIIQADFPLDIIIAVSPLNMQVIFGTQSFLARGTLPRNLRSYCSASQLVEDLDRVSSELKWRNRFSIPTMALNKMREEILANSYSLSPLRLEFIRQMDLYYYLKRHQKASPDDILAHTPFCSRVSRIIHPLNNEDSLVLLAVSVSLLRILKGELPRAGVSSPASKALPRFNKSRTPVSSSSVITLPYPFIRLVAFLVVPSTFSATTRYNSSSSCSSYHLGCMSDHHSAFFYFFHSDFSCGSFGCSFFSFRFSFRSFSFRLWW